MLRKILNRLIPPSEVEWTRRALIAAAGEHPSEGVAEALRRAMELVADTERTVYSIRVDRQTPETLAAILLANAAGPLLSSGRYHVYRGVLSPAGHALLALWRRCNEFLVAEGKFPSEHRAEDEREMSSAIKNAG